MVKKMYSIFMTMADLLFKFVSLFHPKAGKIVAGRKLDKARITDTSLVISGPVIWFHCASMGEWEQTIPVVNAIKKKSTFKIFVSFFSPSGYENAKNKEIADLIFYLPTDGNHSYDFIFDKFDIAALVFCRYDLWPALIWKAETKKIPLILIGAEVKPGSKYLKKNSFFGRLLSQFEYISCNDMLSHQLFQDHGFVQSRHDGSPKIERAILNTESALLNSRIEDWAEGYQVIVGGSVWAPELELIGQWYKKNKDKKIKWILAPHEPGPVYSEAAGQIFGKEFIEYSKFDDEHLNTVAIVVDSIGLLSKLYKFAGLAIVGGGFGKGIHNILEPAAFGIPVISGDNYSKFSEAETLKQLNIFYPVKNFEEFNQTLNLLLNEENISQRVRSGIDQLKDQNSGVSNKISNKILNIITGNV